MQRLVDKIEYKAKIENIEVVKIKENYNKKRRISGGIFVTNEHKKINVDINGSLNILRKYLKDNSPNQEIAMDNGREQRPIKKRVA